MARPIKRKRSLAKLKERLRVRLLTEYMKKSVKIIIAGSVLFAGGIVFGVGGTVVNMIEAFDVIEASGVGDPDALAAEIGDSLIATVIGIPVSFVGFCMFLGGIIAYFVGRNKGDVPEAVA